MGRLPTGRLSLIGPQSWDENGRFIARRPFRLNGRALRRGDELTIAEAGSPQAMRRLVSARQVACIQEGLEVPEALRGGELLEPADAPVDPLLARIVGEEADTPDAVALAMIQSADGPLSAPPAPAAAQPVEAAPSAPAPQAPAAATPASAPAKRRPGRPPKTATPSHDVRPA